MSNKQIDELLLQMKGRKSKLERILSENNISFDVQNEESSVFSTECSTLAKLKVAAIMDTFTLGNFRDECELFEVTADNWKSQIDEFNPDLFFLESAWNGKNKSWYKKIANGSKDLYDLTNYCHSKGIPVIFWNKEDPVYTDVFMSAASCSDFVFTTDFDCIERYKKTLQHNNVYLLHFSAQPRIHNPIEIHDRKDKFCFAGAYYHRYKDRSKVFDNFADVFEKGKGLEIFDRNYKSARPEHAFPARYNKMILGSLKSEDIHVAYKGYNYNINMNSVGQSQTMFARRVYELLASNTVSVGNYARGVKNIFGDLTICTDNASSMEKQLENYCGTDEKYRKYRLLGLRTVMKDHLCEDRLGYIAKCVFGKDIRKQLPEITVISSAKTPEEKNQVRKSFDRQTYDKKTLVFSSDESLNISDASFIGAMSPHDHYGENYLLDLVLSLRYSNADGFGKNCYYKKDNEITLGGSYDETYKKCEKLFSTRCIVKSSLIKDADAFAKGEYIQGDLFCTDEFNYCENNDDDICMKSDDMHIADRGINLDDINAAAKSIDYSVLDCSMIRIPPQEMFNMCRGRVKGLTVNLDGSKISVMSKLPENKDATLYFTEAYSVDELNTDSKIQVTFGGSGELENENICIFLNGSMKEIMKFSSQGNKAIVTDVPSGTKFIKFALKITGGGTKDFAGITVGSASAAATPFLSRSETLVLADRYPSYDDLYRYMFIHKRILLYKENDIVPDMMTVSIGEDSVYREFESVNVTDGDAEKLTNILENGRIKTVCVHFLNPYLWSVLKNYLDEIDLIVWSHGSDIQPWHRRKFNYNTEKETAEAMALSEKREKFWKEVFEYTEKYNVKFVYVSDFFRKQVEEDYDVNLSDRSYVIHNCIDTDLFSYEKKDENQRYSVMSVKSFSTKTYANDITQNAILKLSNEPEFARMTFDIYGDGVRFDEDTKLIKKFSNVHLHKGFLTQSEIAKIHKTHGIYIATTRMDTQGVSRDEAMSSGLVPITNRVAAIPEFTDDSCAMVVEPEDGDAVADAIMKVVRDEKLFSKMSENAALHVRNMSSKKYTIDKETELIQSIGELRNKND